MKKLVLLIIFLSSIQIQAQFWKDKINGNGNIITEHRKVGNFSQLNVIGAFEVIVVPNTAGDITVTADENLLSIIEIYAKSDKLYIKINKNFNLNKYTKLQVEVPVEYLSKISLLGSGKIYNQQAIDWKEIKLKLTGSGDMNILLDVRKVTADVTGSGDINLDGKTISGNYFVTGSGEIHAKKLEADDAIVKITGSGDVYANAKNIIKANLLGSGDLYYYNNPKQTNIKILGSGEAIQK